MKNEIWEFSLLFAENTDLISKRRNLISALHYMNVNVKTEILQIQFSQYPKENKIKILVKFSCEQDFDFKWSIDKELVPKILVIGWYILGIPIGPGVSPTI